MSGAKSLLSAIPGTGFRISGFGQRGPVDMHSPASTYIVPDMYRFIASGDVLKNAGARYGGNTSIAAIPDTHAMLLSDIGVRGFLARRRECAGSAASTRVA